MYKQGDLVIVRGKALSQDGNAFFIGMILSGKEKRYVKEYDDLWCTKELIWEKVYKVLTQGKIININHYDIKGKAE